MAPLPVKSGNVTVLYAIESFLASQGPQGRNVEKNTHHGFEVLLLKRLIPFCQHRGYEQINELDSLDVTTKFVESWMNLQLTRNGKNEVPPLEPLPLADTTKKRQNWNVYGSFSGIAMIGDG